MKIKISLSQNDLKEIDKALNLAQSNYVLNCDWNKHDEILALRFRLHQSGDYVFNRQKLTIEKKGETNEQIFEQLPTQKRA